MNKVTRWETFDGNEYGSREDADEHLEQLRGDIICKLAARITALDGKYSAVIKLLDDSVDDIAYNLVQIDNDKVINAADQDG